MQTLLAPSPEPERRAVKTVTVPSSSYDHYDPKLQDILQHYKQLGYMVRVVSG